jgi:penicillin-binding protein 1B
MPKFDFEKILQRVNQSAGLLLVICGFSIGVALIVLLLAGGGISGGVQIVLDHPGASKVVLSALALLAPVLFLNWVVRLRWTRPWMFAAIMAAVVILFVAGLSFFTAAWVETPSRAEFRKLTDKQSYSVHLVDRDGQSLGAYHPTQREGGIYVPLDTLPKWFLGDLKTIEGWSDYGVSIPDVGRAVVKRLAGLEGGGASTITMQTYRILTGHKDSTLFRKAVEAVAAVEMSLTFTEAQILSLYVNNIRWAAEGGHDGLGYAARRLFSKYPSDLTRREALTLMSGLSEPKRSQQLRVDSVGQELRRKYNNRVDLLRREDRIFRREYEALHDSLPAPDRHRIAPSSYGLFKGQVTDKLKWMMGPAAWSLDDGLRVETTLDKTVNGAASKALADGPLRDGTRGTFLLVNRETEVLAYTTDEKLLRTSDDLFTTSNTIPASRWKPCVYTCLADQMLASGHTREKILGLKLPTRYRVNEDLVIDDEIPEDSLTLRKALIRSKDAPVYYVVNELLTPTYVRRCAKRFRIRSLRALPSIGIGSMGVSELNLAGAYNALFVRNSVYRPPSFVRQITTKSGRVIYNAARHRKNDEPQVVFEAASDLIKQVLREAVYKEKGTSSPFFDEVPGLEGLNVATKTGTSSSKSVYRYRGFTGTVSEYTFSTTMQGEYLTGTASNTALPLAAAVFNRLQNEDLFP